MRPRLASGYIGTIYAEVATSWKTVLIPAGHFEASATNPSV